MKSRQDYFRNNIEEDKNQRQKKRNELNNSKEYFCQRTKLRNHMIQKYAQTPENFQKRKKRGRIDGYVSQLVEYNSNCITNKHTRLTMEK